MTSRYFHSHALPKLKDIEGGYVNDPDDPGGETNHGITKAVARAFGYKGEMRDMPYETAADIYAQRYWHSLRLDDIVSIDLDIALELFDSGVLCGVSRAGTWLQQWLNGFNRYESDWPDIEVDGRIGNATVNTLRHFVNARGRDGARVMHAALQSSQACHFLTTGQEKYLFGWMLNRVANQTIGGSK